MLVSRPIRYYVSLYGEDEIAARLDHRLPKLWGIVQNHYQTHGAEHFFFVFFVKFQPCFVSLTADITPFYSKREHSFSCYLRSEVSS